MIEGIRLESQRHEIIHPEEQVWPLHDYLLLKSLPWEPSRTIQIAGNTRRTLRAEVVATGPGCYPLRYNRDRTKYWHSQAFRKTAVKKGDIVELGGLQLDGYTFFKLTIGHEEFMICRDEDICAVIDRKSSTANSPVTAE